MITIYDQNRGNKPVKIKAFKTGVSGLAVHRRYRNEEAGWDITHVPSGRRLQLEPFCPFRDKESAIRAAKTIADLGPWNLERESVTAFGLREYVYRALEKEFGWEL
jgi:hypothetical protein